MRIFQTKSIERLKTIAANSATTFLPGIGNLLCSMLVIRLMLPEWWGDIAIWQLYMYISVQICAWGNKDFLIREFSQNPTKISANWMESFSGRFFILIPAMLLTWFISPDIFAIGFLSLWILLRYIQQAFEVIILYTRKFSLVIVSELIGILITLTGLFYVKDDHSFQKVIIIISSGYFIKTLIQLVYFRKYFNNNHSFKPNFEKLKKGLPFMVLGFAGVMYQKSDLICITFFVDKYHIAQYQVFSSFIILMQAFPALIAGPYIKNIYRISPSSFKSFQFQFAMIGISISIILSIVTYFSIKYIYHFDLPLSIYFFGFLYAVLTYFYMLKIVLLFKIEKQIIVMKVSLIGVIISIISCLFLIPVLNIQGAVISNIIAQLFIFVLFQYFSKKYQKSITL